MNKENDNYNNMLTNIEKEEKIAIAGFIMLFIMAAAGIYFINFVYPTIQNGCPDYVGIVITGILSTIVLIIFACIEIMGRVVWKINRED